jgi:hypothetical protein
MKLLQVRLGDPRAGSMLNHRTLTAAVIDSREFIAAQRRAERQLLLPEGTRIAFTGGTDCNDHQRIWSTLDRVHTKHPRMVLLHRHLGTVFHDLARRKECT